MATKIDIISGFLGAGKTTLIKKLLKEAYADEQVVLIENEFGEIGIDGGFLKEAGIQIREMNSGCICCSLVGDFGTSLKEVVDKYHPDRILIEPSGVGKLSDVIKAVQGVQGDVDIVLNSYTTVVDAKKCKMYMRNFGEFFDNQVEYAGAIIMSRTDIIDEKKAQQAMELLRGINAKAAIITTPIEKLDGRKILEVMEKPVSLEEELRKRYARSADMYMNMESIIITITTMIMNVAVDMITKNMNIITMTTTMNAVADMIIMIITIITQMRYLQAGDVRRLRNTQEKVLRRCLRLFQLLKITVLFFVQRECFLQKTEHGFILTWFRRKQRSVKVHRNTQVVSA